MKKKVDVNKIVIRKTKKNDYAAVSFILRTSKLVDDWFTEKLFQKMLARNCGSYFVAIINGLIVGTVFSANDGGYFGFIYKMAVLPRHQHKGIASALVRRAVKNLHDNGIDWYFATVDKSNSASLGVLAKHGMHPNKQFYMVDRWENVDKD